MVEEHTDNGACKTVGSPPRRRWVAANLDGGSRGDRNVALFGPARTVRELLAQHYAYLMRAAVARQQGEQNATRGTSTGWRGRSIVTCWLAGARSRAS